MSIQGRLIRILLIAPVFFMAMVVIHESGHAYAITKTGVAGARILVWPGFELYPNFGTTHTVRWPGKSIAITHPVPLSRISILNRSSPRSAHFSFFHYEKIRQHQNIIILMGVVATTAFSILSLTYLSLFRPKGALLWILGAGSLMHMDALTYTIFPIFLGAPHLLFWGGSISEPITSLTNLGLSQTFSVSMVMVFSVIQFAWLYYLLSDNTDTSTSRNIQGQCSDERTSRTHFRNPGL